MCELGPAGRIGFEQPAPIEAFERQIALAG